MSTNVELNRTDAWLLGALTDARPGRPMDLPGFVNRADWLNRMIPSFEEVRYSLQRLEKAGYLIVHRDAKAHHRLEATAAAFAVRARVKAHTLGDVLSDLAGLVDALPYPEVEVEDRSLGPLSGFTANEWNRAVARNASEMKWLVRGTLALFAIPALVASAIARIVRPRDMRNR
jgi:hypothetical protein